MDRKKLKLKARELIKGRVFRIFFFLLVVVSLIPVLLSTADSAINNRLYYDNTTPAEAGQVVSIEDTKTYTTVLSKSEWVEKFNKLDFTGRFRLSFERSMRHVIVEGDRIHPNAEAKKNYNLVSSIAHIVISFIIILTVGALSFSGISGMLKVDKDKNAPKISEDFLTGFKGANYPRAVLAWIRVGIFTFLWSLLLIIPGIMKAYSYAMTMYILADNPKLSAKEAQKKSIAMMQGHRFEYFKLQFSFFWWYLLAGLTFGIASFYVIPYTETAKVLFYKKLAKK